MFGIANLAAFLFAPFFGRYGNAIGPKLLYNTGAYLQVIITLVLRIQYCILIYEQR